MTIDRWCHDLEVRLTGDRFQSRSVLTRFHENRVMLLCPLTFMNLSGKAVRACVDYYDLDPENILIIHDDIDLPVGKIKVVRSFGSGGHKGVRSIIDHLGGMQLQRVKIGIGRPQYDEAIENYVLASFYKDEKDIVEDVLHMATEACELFVLRGIEPAMNQINCQNLANEGGM